MDGCASGAGAGASNMGGCASDVGGCASDEDGSKSGAGGVRPDADATFVVDGCTSVVAACAIDVDGGAIDVDGGAIDVDGSGPAVLSVISRACSLFALDLGFLAFLTMHPPLLAASTAAAIADSGGRASSVSGKRMCILNPWTA
jgi:hypothetical protein